MGWRRRHRKRPDRCSRRDRARAHDRGIVAYTAFVKRCGPLAGVPAKAPRRRARRVR